MDYVKKCYCESFRRNIYPVENLKYFQKNTLNISLGSIVFLIDPSKLVKLNSYTNNPGSDTSNGFYKDNVADRFLEGSPDGEKPLGKYDKIYLKCKLYKNRHKLSDTIIIKLSDKLENVYFENEKFSRNKFNKKYNKLYNKGRRLSKCKLLLKNGKCNCKLIQSSNLGNFMALKKFRVLKFSRNRLNLNDDKLLYPLIVNIDSVLIFKIRNLRKYIFNNVNSYFYVELYFNEELISTNYEVFNICEIYNRFNGISKSHLLSHFYPITKLINESSNYLGEVDTKGEIIREFEIFEGTCQCCNFDSKFMCYKHFGDVINSVKFMFQYLGRFSDLNSEDFEDGGIVIRYNLYKFIQILYYMTSSTLVRISSKNYFLNSNCTHNSDGSTQTFPITLISYDLIVSYKNPSIYRVTSPSNIELNFEFNSLRRIVRKYLYTNKFHLTKFNLSEDSNDEGPFVKDKEVLGDLELEKEIFLKDFDFEFKFLCPKMLFILYYKSDVLSLTKRNLIYFKIPKDFKMLQILYNSTLYGVKPFLKFCYGLYRGSEGSKSGFMELLGNGRVVEDPHKKYFESDNFVVINDICYDYYHINGVLFKYFDILSKNSDCVCMFLRFTDYRRNDQVCRLKQYLHRLIDLYDDSDVSSKFKNSINSENFGEYGPECANNSKEHFVKRIRLEIWFELMNKDFLMLRPEIRILVLKLIVYNLNLSRLKRFFLQVFYYLKYDLRQLLFNRILETLKNDINLKVKFYYYLHSNLFYVSKTFTGDGFSDLTSFGEFSDVGPLKSVSRGVKVKVKENLNNIYMYYYNKYLKFLSTNHSLTKEKTGIIGGGVDVNCEGIEPRNIILLNNRFIDYFVLILNKINLISTFKSCKTRNNKLYTLLGHETLTLDKIINCPYEQSEFRQISEDFPKNVKNDPKNSNYAAVDDFSNCPKSFIVPFLFNLNYKIDSVYNFFIYKSSNYPLILSLNLSCIDLFDNNQSSNCKKPLKSNKKIMFKYNNKFDNDLIYLSVLGLIRNILKSNRIKVYLKLYKLIPIYQNLNFMELLSTCTNSKDNFEGFSEIYYNNYLKLMRGLGPKIGRRYLEILLNNLAVNVLVNYLLRIGDRHYENVIVTDLGFVVNVDSNFLFDDVTYLKPLEFMKSPLILDPYIKSIVVSNYHKFVSSFLNIFKVLRTNHKLLISLLYNLGVKVSNVVEFESRLMLQLKDDELKVQVSQLIQNSLNNNYIKIVNYLHYFNNFFK